MLIGHLIVAVLVATVSAIVTVVLGNSFLKAMLIYVVSGNAYFILMLAGVAVKGYRSGGKTTEVEVTHDQQDQTRKPALRALIVDDDPLASEILIELISEIEDVEIHSYASAAEAQTAIMARKTDFDCYFLDIEMPQMDGVELANWIRSDNADQTTPIIMATAKSDRRNVTEAFSVGANDYVTKPFNTTELERCFKDLREAKNSSDWVEAGDTATKPKGGVASVHSVQNYLLQLNQGGLFATNVFTLKINLSDASLAGPAQVAEQTKQAVNYVMADVLKSLETERAPLLTYAGDGVFLGVVNGNEKTGLAAFSKLPETVLVNGHEMTLEKMEIRPFKLPDSGEKLALAVQDMLAFAKTAEMTDHIGSAQTA